MRKHILCCCLLLCLPIVAKAQSQHDTSYQIYGGYTSLSNSFNGLPGKQHPLNAWEVTAGLPERHGIRFIVDYMSFYGKNQQAPQRGLMVQAGVQYERHIGREGIFVQGMVGEADLNHNWYNNGGNVTTASSTEFLGGGFDTPISRSFAFRIEGGVQHTNFALMINKIVPFPYYRPAGLPDNFARMTAGLVWTHHRTTAEQRAFELREGLPSPRRDTQLTFLGEKSIGHYRYFGGQNHCTVALGGLQYDHDMGIRFIGSEVYYSADIEAMSLRQPQYTTAYGDQYAQYPTEFKRVPGIAIAPVGLRYVWLSKHAVEPFFEFMGGMVFFNQKAFSPVGSYYQFTMHESLGVQFRVTHKWGLRLDAGDLHMSNAFVVPSDPGLDSMMIEVGLTRDIGKHSWFL